jgi:hypothetical protein
MTPNLLFYAVFDEAEALARLSNGEVVHPASQHRIDQLDYPTYGWDWYRRNTSLSLRNNAVRFFIFGV